MSFATWLDRRLIKRHRPEKQEIGNLLAVADRCLADARQSIALTVGSDAAAVRKLDGFRRKRHRAAYDVAGAVSEQEVTELVALAAELRDAVAAWLAAEHPTLV